MSEVTPPTVGRVVHFYSKHILNHKLSRDPNKPEIEGPFAALVIGVRPNAQENAATLHVHGSNGKSPVPADWIEHDVPMGHPGASDERFWCYPPRA